MTLENITPEALNRIEKELTKALNTIEYIRQDAACSIITIKQAAAAVNRIGTSLEKAIYPEDQEA